MHAWGHVCNNGPMVAHMCLSVCRAEATCFAKCTGDFEFEDENLHRRAKKLSKWVPRAGGAPSQRPGGYPRLRIALSASLAFKFLKN